MKPPEPETSSISAESPLVAGATPSIQELPVTAAAITKVPLIATENEENEPLPPTQSLDTAAVATTADTPVADVTPTGTTTTESTAAEVTADSTSSSSSSSTPSPSPSPQKKKTPEAEEPKRYRVDIHLCGKNHKFPGHYSLTDKRIIHEWARVWKNDNMRQQTHDSRSVLCLRKNQQPQRWSQKDAFWWFHTKKVRAAVAVQHFKQANAMNNGGMDVMDIKHARYVSYFFL